MGFTSYEGSLSQDEYPTRFNADNFLTAYNEWASPRYNEAANLDYDTKLLLARRKFNMHACAEVSCPTC